MRPLFLLCVAAFLGVSCAGEDELLDAASPDAGLSDGSSSPPDAGVRSDAEVGPDGSDAGVVSGSCATPDPPHSASEQLLLGLPADSWWTAADTPLAEVCAFTPCAGITDAWSGGAYDPIHNLMLVWGGGHADYSGNELLAFDLGTLSWRRLTEASPPSYQNQDPLPDGQPVSRHSYDGLQYLVHANRFFGYGGSRWRDGSGTGRVWTFDVDGGLWEDRQPQDAPSLSNPYSIGSAYDPQTGRVYAHITSAFVAYDFGQNRWFELADFGNAPYWPRYEIWGDKRGLLDSSRDLLFFFGSGLYLVYDIANDTFVTDDWVTSGGSTFSNAEHVGNDPQQTITTGGGEVIRAGGPGADYDPTSDDIVAWVGGAVWVLDLESRVWSRGSGAGAPAEPTSTGTFGRFRYVPRTNVFVLVNGSNESVAFYKHTAGCGG